MADSVHSELVGALAALKQAHPLAGPGIDLILQGFVAGRADYVAEDAADGNDRTVGAGPASRAGRPLQVPTLRNVAMIPPYFHDGPVATLPQAGRVMARVQLGKRLSGEQTRAIVSFLDSLTGPLPADFVAAPALPVGPYRETR